jgi:hypothetical protein
MMAEPTKQNPIAITPDGDDIETGFTKAEDEFDALYAWIADIAADFKGTVAPSTVWEGLKWHKTGVTPEELWEYKSGAWAKVMNLTDAASSGMRQCVLTGPVDVSGNPALAEAGTGLAVNLLGPIIANFAAGYSGANAVNNPEVIASLVSAWTGLPATQTVYLYIDRNPSTGAITYGWTIVKPVYQRHEPTGEAGLHWFNGDKMQYHDGVEWADKQRVFPLYCTTDADSVTAVYLYPYSDWWRNIDIDASGFVGILSPAENTVQKALDKLGKQSSSGYRNLLIVNNAATPNTKADVTADMATLYDASNNAKSFFAVSLTGIDLGVNGVNGLDTGTKANSTDYFLWMVGKPDGTIAGLWSTSATAPTMPDGYTYKWRCGWNRTDSSGNIYRVKQVNDEARYVVTAATNTANLPIMDSGAKGNVLTTWAAIAIGAYVPPTAVFIDFLGSSGTTAGGLVLAAPNTAYGFANSTTNPPPFQISSGTTNAANTPGRFMLESTNIYWASQQATCLIACSGWEDKI